MWTAKTFATAETIEVNTHFFVAAEIFEWWNTGCIVHQQGDPGGARDRKRIHEALVTPGGVDHRCLWGNRGTQIVEFMHEHQFASGEPYRTIKRDAAAEHDDFVLQACCVGQLPDIFRFGAGNASGCRCRHRACRTGRYHAGFCSGKFRKTLTNSPLQFEHVDEMLRGLLHGSLHFR